MPPPDSTSLGDASDEELMRRYVAGDEHAFRELFGRYAPALFRLVRRRMRNEEEARDIVQQTMLHVHRARNDFRQDSRLRPWLFTIALNLVREHYRRLGRRREVALDPAIPVEDLDTRRADEPLEQAQSAARVREALATLPASQREVIELHWFGESPYDEIAVIVGASVGAVRVRAHRGYERLRKILLPEE